MADEPRKPSSPLADAIRLFIRNKPALIAFVLILGLATAAATGAVYAGKKPDNADLIRMEEAELLGDKYKTEAVKSAVLDPQKTELKDTFLPPFSTSRANPEKYYYLGTDDLGRDVLARLWAGSTISLTIGFLAVGISVLLGISLGGIAGYFGRSRVSMPVFVTILLALAWGILLAAEIGPAAWTCFAAACGLFTIQLGVAAIGGHWRAIVFFLLALALFGGATYYNRGIEQETPEGALYQEASATHVQARELLLEIREFGHQMKAYQDEAPGNLKKITDQQGLPEWAYAGQLRIEARFKLLETRVARFERQKYTSANLEALRLSIEQQERADHLEQYLEDYSERNKQAKEDEKQALELSASLFKQDKRDEGRAAAAEAANHAARAATFDPEQLKKRIVKLRESGSFNQKYMEAVTEGMETPLEELAAAYDKAETALKQVLEQAPSDSAALRQRQYSVEEASRARKRAAAEFQKANLLLRVKVLCGLALAGEKNADRKAVLEEMKKLCEAFTEKLAAHSKIMLSEKQDDETTQKRAESQKQFAAALKEIGTVSARWAKFFVDEKTGSPLPSSDMENEIKQVFGKTEPTLKALGDALGAISALGALAKREQDAGKLKDKLELIEMRKTLDKDLPPFKVQGSNDLIARRGDMRLAYVIKYDTEAKNNKSALRVAENLNGSYRYGFYRFTSNFITTTLLLLLLAVSALALLASGQAAVTDMKSKLKALYIPTITVDDLVMRFTEIMMTIPVIFLILAILAVFDRDVYITMGVIGLTGWMGTTRFVRAEILSLREQDFIQAARSLGVSDFRIIWRHLVPNAISPVLVSASISVAGAVLVESTLSFLGIGAKPEQTTWGMILSGGREYIFDAPHLTWIPGVAILITVLSFNLLGEGLREAFNPKLRGR